VNHSFFDPDERQSGTKTAPLRFFTERPAQDQYPRKEIAMLYWALVFLVVAIIAGALGFGGIAGTSAGIAQILFFIFLAFLVISLIAALFRRA